MMSFSTTSLMQVLGIFLVMVAIVSGFNLTFEDCGSDGAKVEAVNVSDCYTDPCTLRHRVTYTTRITFKALKSTKSLTNKVSVRLWGHDYPFRSIERDACKGTSCPILTGESKAVTAKSKVDRRIRRTKIEVKWILLDDQNKNYICVNLPFRVQ